MFWFKTQPKLVDNNHEALKNFGRHDNGPPPHKSQQVTVGSFAA